MQFVQFQLHHLDVKHILPSALPAAFSNEINFTMRSLRPLIFFNACFVRQKPRTLRNQNFATTGIIMSAISEAIKKDHREIEEYYNNILNATDADAQERWQNQFVWELARHSIGEELIVYPAMEKHVGNGKERADKDRQEHQVVS